MAGSVRGDLTWLHTWHVKMQCFRIRDDGVEGAAFIAALGALVPATGSIPDAVESAIKEIPENSGAFEAVKFGISIAGKDDAVVLLHDKYKDYPAVHVLNNLALVVWAILTYEDDFSAAIGETVAAGLDTDCNGATVGGILGLAGKPIPEHWTKPWNNRVAVDLAGVGELDLNELADGPSRCGKDTVYKVLALPELHKSSTLTKIWDFNP